MSSSADILNCDAIICPKDSTYCLVKLDSSYSLRRVFRLRACMDRFGIYTIQQPKSMSV